MVETHEPRVVVKMRVLGPSVIVTDGAAVQRDVVSYRHARPQTVESGAAVMTEAAMLPILLSGRKMVLVLGVSVSLLVSVVADVAVVLRPSASPAKARSKQLRMALMLPVTSLQS